ncbi:oxidoreductase [Phytomonospora endophytica]|uniref:NAD(P)-dependent dehydrogenase (Short-subunit alcohol dehydrogenase family) n=1 Tax=Phytomonospora endophytica TaxID=714109 RepID=A0A841FG29_9ACTN|nr:oxidoreductase [Phytomonospora endophytica]MBB6034824.1 NAD(P)-dependent dehydrogenase (short-subunit alcohol dehydrogenase family) [Phytomonospora endophytica]GIG68972.1 short-chain dehydrogenase [Phytomonospora endophytica]
MTRHRWTAADIPDLTGRSFAVTGANGGLGLATTRALAAKGGRVILAVRDVTRGRAAVAGLPPENVDVRRLDLTDPASIDAFADGLAADHGRLDVLVNNAGVMGPPRTLTPGGHELQFAANHLGHFALTTRLLGLLAAGRDPRVVTVSSFVHRKARMRFDDLTGERGYSPMGFYNMSKLANAIFGLELHRRLTAAGSPVASVLAHPGYSATGLQTASTSGLTKLFLGRFGNALLAQPAERGAWPQLFAATDPGVVGGEFIGPDGMGEMRGHPTRVRPSADALDEENGRRLWEVSERATAAVG